MKKIYKNKKTGKFVITSETLDPIDYQFIKFQGEIKIKDGQMSKKRIIKK
jgi:hypothetical protein